MLLTTSQYPLSQIITSNPLNRSHPLNYKRYAWWLGIRELAGGKYLYDLVNNNNMVQAGTTSTAVGWRSTPRAGGQFGCLKFDGATNFRYKTTSYPGGSLDGTSWSFWFTLPATISAETAMFFTGLASNGLGFTVLADGGSFLLYNYTSAPTIASQTAYANGNWHNMTLVGTGSSSWSCYIDGLLVSTLTLLTNVSLAGELAIGTFESGGFEYKGQIDDFSIWMRPLSASDVWNHYTLGLRGYPGVLNRYGDIANVLYSTSLLTISPAQGSLVFAGYSALTGISLLPVVGSLSLTGTNSTTGLGAVVNAGALSLLGANNSLGLKTSPVVGSIAVTGANSSLGFGSVPVSGVLTISGTASRIGIGNSPLSGSLTLTGTNSTTGIGAVVNTGVISVSGQIVSLGAGLIPPPGALIFTGYFPTETHGSAPITVLFLPQYQMTVRPSPQRIVGANGPLRWTLTRIDGQSVSLPTSAVMNVVLPDGTTSTGTVSIEAGVSEPVIYLDGKYSYSEDGIYRVTLLVTMSDGTTIGNCYSVDYSSYSFDD